MVATVVHAPAARQAILLTAQKELTAAAAPAGIVGLPGIVIGVNGEENREKKLFIPLFGVEIRDPPPDHVSARKRLNQQRGSRMQAEDVPMKQTEKVSTFWPTRLQMPERQEPRGFCTDILVQAQGMDQPQPQQRISAMKGRPHFARTAVP